MNKIQKRDGSIVTFDKNKIAEAIFKAAQSVGEHDLEKAKDLANFVEQSLEKKYDGHTIPKVEDIQDLVEQTLMSKGQTSVAKAYILYRENRKNIRDEKIKILGKEDELKLPINSIKVLSERYLKKNNEGKLIETPKEMFQRVAENIASADLIYNNNVENLTTEFFELMSSLKFLPNSPTLMNAGNELQQLSGCFVLPVGDSIQEIFDGVKNAAMIHKSGGGTGFAFSRLRPRNDVVMSTKGISSGPISFMKVYNVATEIIKQGGRRRGANMGILRVDHPDIINFINCKENENDFNNFNISVGLTEKFMQAVENDEEYELYNPRTKSGCGQLRAKDVFNLIVTNAWKNGEPGIIFLDRMNKDNPTPEIGEIESTNPCITGDMLIPTDKGLIRMNKLMEDYPEGGISIVTDNRVPIKIPTANGQFLLMQQKQLGVQLDKITKVFDNGIKDVFKLITKSGYELTATSDHKILNYEQEWIPLKDLKVGDKICIQSGAGKFNSNNELELQLDNKLNLPKEWSKELGQILGWLIGDGWLRDGDKDRRVGFVFGSDDFELLPSFKSILNNWYGKNIKEIKRENGVIHLSYHSKDFIEFFKALGVKAVKAKDKRVPEKIFTATYDAVIGFLQGIFTADGTIGKLYKEIRLTSSSELLLKDVQLLLLNLGIKSKIYFRKYSNSKPFTYTTKNNDERIYNSNGNYYELLIEGNGRKLFLEKIGFLNKKQDKLKNSVKFCKKIIFEDEISSINYKGQETVYDLTEPRTVSFIANGIVVLDCGEQPLLPFESCNLGSINLTKFVKNNDIDYDELKRVVHLSVHFLDNVIDKNRFPLPEIEKITKANRKIGLGIMGFADMLLQLSIPYNSEEAVKIAEKVMGFIQEESKQASIKLAETRGSFPNIEKSIYREQKIRNATRTTIAPTGSIGMIADASNGIEPLFAISFVKQNILGGNYKLLYVNQYFEKVAKEKRFYSQELMEQIAKTGSVQHVEGVPEEIKKVFVVSHDIDPIWHIKIQAAFQRHIENAVSKTVNFTNDATTKDVEQTYLLAYRLGCKGVTIYRDGSRNAQVINLDTTKQYKKKEVEEDLCPQCKSKLYRSEGCSTCPGCGYSKCSV